LTDQNYIQKSKS